MAAGGEINSSPRWSTRDGPAVGFGKRRSDVVRVNATPIQRGARWRARTNSARSSRFCAIPASYPPRRRAGRNHRDARLAGFPRRQLRLQAEARGQISLSRLFHRGIAPGRLHRRVAAQPPHRAAALSRGAGDQPRAPDGRLHWGRPAASGGRAASISSSSCGVSISTNCSTTSRRAAGCRRRCSTRCAPISRRFMRGRTPPRPGRRRRDGGDRRRPRSRICASAARPASMRRRSIALRRDARRAGARRHCSTRGALPARYAGCTATCICATSVCVDGKPVLFDCIEFSEELASIDVLYDLAFLLMDLDHRGFGGFANLVVNRYLDLTGEDDGLAALPLFSRCGRRSGRISRQRWPSMAGAARIRRLNSPRRAVISRRPRRR